MAAPNDLEHLIELLARLPGLGPRSARRVALYLITHKTDVMAPLAAGLAQTAEAVQTCQRCGNISTADPCSICTDPDRVSSTLCVVEDVADLWAVERTHSFQGRYHVLGGTLSALDGVGPDALNIPLLLKRVREEAVAEVILATNATVEGQATAHYLTEQLAPLGVNITRLAHGVPLGGELDYLDDGTLTAALAARRPF